jgi:hypothetical protein
MVVPTCKPAFRLFLSRPGGLVGWVEPDETHHFFGMAGAVWQTIGATS